MSSANNVVSTMAAYLVQGTAATNVSNVTNAKDASRAANTSFDMVLNKVSDTFVQNKTSDVSKQVNQSPDNTKQTSTVETTKDTVKTDDQIKADNGSNVQEVQDQTDNRENVVTDENQGTEADTKLQEAINEAGKEMMSRSRTRWTSQKMM